MYKLWVKLLYAWMKLTYAHRWKPLLCDCIYVEMWGLTLRGSIKFAPHITNTKARGASKLWQGFARCVVILVFEFFYLFLILAPFSSDSTAKRFARNSCSRQFLLPIPTKKKMEVRKSERGRTRNRYKKKSIFRQCVEYINDRKYVRWISVPAYLKCIFFFIASNSQLVYIFAVEQTKYETFLRE